MSVDDYLNSVDYEKLKKFIPSDNVLKYINFIHMCSDEPMENKTPPVHLYALNEAFKDKNPTTIMCFRGFAKTSLFAEFLILYVASFGELPIEGFGKVNFMIYLGDSIENGVKSLRKNIEYRYNNSQYLQNLIPNLNIKYSDNDGNEADSDINPGRKFTDVRLEFINKRGDHLVVRLYGAKALSLDSVLYTDTGITTIKDCKIGDKIFGADGRLCKIIAKSEIFNKPMYKIVLDDGREIKVSEDHINSVVLQKRVNSAWKKVEANLTTKELLAIPLTKTINMPSNKYYNSYSFDKNLVFIKNIEPMQYSTKNLLIDPYTLGLLLGGGTLIQRKSSFRCELTAHKDDFHFYKDIIPYDIGSMRVDNRNNNAITTAIKGLTKYLRYYNLSSTSQTKFIPSDYLIGDYNQRLSLLQGLMDTDGTCTASRGSISFSTTSPQLCSDVIALARSLGITAIKTIQKSSFRIILHTNLPIFKLPRKLNNMKLNKSDLVAIKDIIRIEDEPSQCIAVDNISHQFITTDYTRTHNTGIRGAKELGKRPEVAIIDDILSDEDARSDTIVSGIEDTVHKALKYALNPTRQKIIWLGTPFNSKDPLYKAVESGAYNVALFPVCERFPCEEIEFKGAWEDRFNYDFVLKAYNEAVGVKKPQSFYQEMMLQIVSSEDKLVSSSDITWFSRKDVFANKRAYNFYITTDLATSQKRNADFSVISVWAINNNGDYMLVDGSCEKRLLDKFIDDLFRLASLYKPLGVGIEISGQQGGFIRWLYKEMVQRNVWFNILSSNNNGEAGIRPVGDKFSRFNMFLPQIKAKKLWFCKEMANSKWMMECDEEFNKATTSGFKSRHDDVIDTISMLGSFEVFRPSIIYDGEEDTNPFINDFNTPKNTVF